MNERTNKRTKGNEGRENGITWYRVGTITVRARLSLLTYPVENLKGHFASTDQCFCGRLFRSETRNYFMFSRVDDPIHWPITTHMNFRYF